MIYRAFASSSEAEWVDRDAEERVVFIEAACRADAAKALTQILMTLWDFTGDRRA